MATCRGWRAQYTEGRNRDLTPLQHLHALRSDGTLRCCMQGADTMSRESFEACVNAFWDGDVGHLTPNDCLHAVWQAAQADAYERAARVCEEVANRFFQSQPLEGNKPYASGQCADAIRALAKGAGNA